jgi:hypothetical protein
VTDWLRWHAAYDDPGSSLARRLGVVRGRIREALASAPGGATVRVLSPCAGDGRDVLPELARGGHAATAMLVEMDRTRAVGAADRARRLGVDGTLVVVGDAGRTSTFSQALPVDLLLLCGIFANVSEDDIRTTVGAVPGMLRSPGTVIWTRGDSAPDLRPSVRRWFVAAGLEEVGFDGGTGPFGVGVARLVSPLDAAPPLPERLFTFRR